MFYVLVSCSLRVLLSVCLTDNTYDIDSVVCDIAFYNDSILALSYDESEITWQVRTCLQTRPIRLHINQLSNYVLLFISVLQLLVSV